MMGLDLRETHRLKHQIVTDARDVARKMALLSSLHAKPEHCKLSVVLHHHSPILTHFIPRDTKQVSPPPTRPSTSPAATVQRTGSAGGGVGGGPGGHGHHDRRASRSGAADGTHPSPLPPPGHRGEHAADEGNFALMPGESNMGGRGGGANVPMLLQGIRGEPPAMSAVAIVAAHAASRPHTASSPGGVTASGAYSESAKHAAAGGEGSRMTSGVYAESARHAAASASAAE